MGGTPRTERRRLRILIALLAASFWLMGLGGGTESGSGPGVPIPEENYTVTVTDRSGQTLQARRFTWEGKVALRGQYGNATVSLPFSKLRSLAVQTGTPAGTPETIRATVTLHTGDTLEVQIERASKCFGETKFGTYEIFFKDVARLEFVPPAGS